MGFFSRMIRKTANVFSDTVSGVKAVTDNPLARMIPGVSHVSTGIGLFRGASDLFGSGSAPPDALPALPSGSASFFGGSGFNMGGDRNPGMIPRGPGGRMAMPFTNPNIPKQYEPFTIDDQFLRLSMRAPKGFVVVRLPGVKPFPMMRDMAIKFNLWKPAKKPPISVTDWESLKRADRVVKKLKLVVKKGQAVSNWSPGGKRKMKTIPARHVHSLPNPRNSPIIVNS